jgi:hypothetical protein
MSKLIILGDGNVSQSYIGETELSESEIIQQMQIGVPIVLENARVFYHQIITLMTPQGPSNLASTKIFPFPLTVYGHRIAIKASTYVSVDSSEDMKGHVKELMDACLDMEKNMRLQQSGLVTASELPRRS